MCTNCNVREENGEVIVTFFGTTTPTINKKPNCDCTVIGMSEDKDGNFVYEEKHISMFENLDDRKKDETCRYERVIFKGDSPEMISRSRIFGEVMPMDESVCSIPAFNQNSTITNYETVDVALDGYTDRIFSSLKDKLLPEKAYNTASHRWVNWTAIRDPKNFIGAHVYESVTLPRQTNIITMYNVPCKINDGDGGYEQGCFMRIDPPHSMHYYTDEVVEKMCTQYAGGGLTEDVISGELFKESPGRIR